MGPTEGFCVFPYTHPEASWLSSPVTAVLPSWKGFILLTGVGTHSLVGNFFQFEAHEPKSGGLLTL